MANFNNMLNRGEQIVWQKKSHISCKLGHLLLALLGLLLIATPIGWVLCLLGVCWLFVPRGTFALTNRRLLGKVGIFSMTAREVAIEGIANVEVAQGIIARLFGCGSIKINPIQASNGIEANTMCVYWIKDPYQLRRLIQDVKEGRIVEAMEAVAMMARVATAAAVDQVKAAPPALLPAASEEWFVAQNGRQVGPVSREEIVARLHAGRLQPQDFVWKQGLDRWTPAEKAGLV